MESLAKQINEEVRKLPEVIEYVKYRELMKNQDIQELKNKLNDAKAMLKQKVKEEDMTGFNYYRKIVLELKEEYDNHPIVKNYMHYQNLVFEILEQLDHIVEI